MKIKHAIELSDEEVDTLFNAAAMPASATYATKEAQAAALEQAKMDFKALLGVYIHHAFKFGKKIGKAKADEKDTLMYKDYQ